MTDLFTSDLHLGHENIIELCGRPFVTIEEMDKSLIDRWNHKVKEDDEVYILGDLIFRSKIHAGSYLDQMKGRKHLIIGNHDSKWQKNIHGMSQYFESVSNMEVITIGDKLITLCHYPMLEWNGSRKAKIQEDSVFWMIHGHIHNRRDGEAFYYIKENLPCALNAGVDINGFEPVTFDELLANNNGWYGRGENSERDSLQVALNPEMKDYYMDGMK